MFFCYLMYLFFILCINLFYIILPLLYSIYLFIDIQHYIYYRSTQFFGARHVTVRATAHQHAWHGNIGTQRAHRLLRASVGKWLPMIEGFYLNLQLCYKLKVNDQQIGFLFVSRYMIEGFYSIWMFQISNVSKSQLLFFSICVATEFPLRLVHVSFLLLEDPFLLVRNSESPILCCSRSPLSLLQEFHIFGPKAPQFTTETSSNQISPLGRFKLPPSQGYVAREFGDFEVHFDDLSENAEDGGCKR